MNYLVRLIGVVIVWPIISILTLFMLLCINLALIIWHFNTKHCEGLSWEYFYWSIENNVLEYDERGNLELYDYFYKTPKAMLLGIKSRVKSLDYGKD